MEFTSCPRMLHSSQLVALRFKPTTYGFRVPHAIHLATTSPLTTDRTGQLSVSLLIWDSQVSLKVMWSTKSESKFFLPTECQDDLLALPLFNDQVIWLQVEQHLL